MTLTIVPITRHNTLLFKEVRLRALQEAPTAFGSTYARESQLSDAEWQQRADRCNGEDGVGYLAMDVDIACGLVGGFLHRRDPTRVHVVSMWVAPSHRRRGVGRLLVDAVANWACKHRAQTLELLVTCNNDAAIHFYQRLGFAHTGRTEPYPNDPALSEWEMARRLPGWGS